MQRKITVLPKASFISYIEYRPEQQELLITMRSLKQYRISEFTFFDFKKIENEQNKGSYIAQNILSGPDKKVATFVRLVPDKEAKQIERKHKSLPFKFLAR